jgi:hypothetical protein
MLDVISDECFRNVSETHCRNTGHVNRSTECRTRTSPGTDSRRVRLAVDWTARCSTAGDLILRRSRLSVAVLASPSRSRNLPVGGKAGGIQTSAPQVHRRALLETLAASRGHAVGTVVARIAFGPTAHISNLFLPVLPYYFCARPSWTGP